MNSQEIHATVKFFANLREYGPNKESVTVAIGTKIKDLVRTYNIPEENRLIILVNGKPHATLEQKIKDNDVISIFPMLAGG